MAPSQRSKTPTAMINEALCKILAYNITVLIHAMYEFGINPESFGAGPAVESEPKVLLQYQSEMDWALAG